jgi:uncharacterized protein (TIGR03437 family)
VLSAADYSPSVAPGSIAALFGTSLASSPTGATFDSHGNLPVNLDGASVTVAGIPAPLFYVSPTQINLQIPVQTPVGQAAVAVTTSSGSTVAGVATVVPFAPAIFVYGSNRGAVTNAITGSLEPFDVTDPSIPDGQTRLSIFATGLDAAIVTGSAVDVYAQSATLGRTNLQVEYAGPQGYYIGLDQINVVLPAALNGAGDMQLFIQMGLAQSNVVLVRIRSNTGPAIGSVSPPAGQPQALITISGSNFAPDTPGTPAGTRNLISFEMAGQAVTSVVPSSATASQLVFYVPYDLQPQGNYLAGTYTLCLTTDERTSCGSDAFTIQTLQPVTGTATGQIATQFLTTLTNYVNTLSGNGLDPTTAAAVKSTLVSSIGKVQADIDATLQGTPSYLPAITTTGAQPVLLTTQGIANFETLIANSGITGQLNAMVERARSRRIGSPEGGRRSIGPFVGDEQGLLDAAQEYSSLLAAESVLQDVTDSNLIKVEVCGLDSLTGGLASAVSGAIFDSVSNVFSTTLFTYELNKIFLKQIDVLPAAVSLSPGAQGTFQVQGEFIRGGVAGSVFQSTEDYLTALVEAQLGNAIGTVDCGDSILGGILSVPTEDILNNLASSLVTYLLSGPDGQALQTLLDEALQDNSPAIIPLSPASLLSHNPAPSDFQVQFSTPGDSTGTVSANSPTAAPEEVLFVVQGGLLQAPGDNPEGTLNVQITQSVPPTASIQVSVTGQTGSGNPPAFSVGQGRLLLIAFQAINISPGTGSIMSYIWLDGQTPIGAAAAVSASLAAGLHHISCVIQNSAGLSSTVEMDVLINSPAGPTVHFSMEDSTGATTNDGGSLSESVAQGAQVQIAFQASVSDSEPIASYAWSVDGKPIGSTANVSAGLGAGNHSVALLVTDSLGSAGNATATVNVVSVGALTAAFNFSGSGQAGQENSVTNYQIPPGGTVPLTLWADRSQGAATYSWSLDGTPFGQGKTATVSVGQGSHTISLIVGNGLGATNTASTTLIVTPTGSATAPTAMLSLSAQNQTVGNNGSLSLTAPANGGVMVAFNASASTAGSGTLSTFQWLNNGVVIGNQAVFSATLAASSNSITVRVANSNGLSGTASAQINIATGQSGTPSISSISTSPNPPINGQGFTITLTGQSFDASNNTMFFNGPGCSPPCGISAGGGSTQVSGQAILSAGTFTVTLKNNTTGLTSNGVSLNVQSSGTPPNLPTLTGLSISPGTVTSGGPATITVTLSGAAPQPTGAPVNLSSSNPSAFPPPSTLVVQPGQTSASTTISAGTAKGSTVVTVMASYGSSNKSAIVTVIPSSSGLALTSISITPSSVSTGAFATLSVTLSGVAPAGGTTVSVQSSNPTAFPAPTSITVPAGQSTNGVSVQAGSVGIATPITVTASYAGGTVTTAVTVNPSASTQVTVTPSAWQPVFTLGGSPATLGFQISSSSKTTLTGTISANVPWITFDGHASYNWSAPESVSVTATPAGLAAGVYNATITVTAPAASNSPVLIPVTMTVLAPLQITTTSLPTATWGQPFSSQLNATGGSGYAWSLQSGSSLPLNLTLSTSGLISGTLVPANSTNTYPFTAIVTDSTNRTAYANLSLVVQAPIVVATYAPSSFQFIVGSTYVEPPNGNNTMSFFATGGTAPYAWTASGLPPGLKIDGTSGFIVGTPTQPGSFPATITATDSTGRIGSDTLTLAAVTTPLVITTPSGQSPPTLPSGTVGVAYNQYLDASGGSNAGYQWTMQGTLPPGLKGQVNPNAGCTSGCSFQFSGTPTQAGTSNFTLQVTDSLGDKAQQTIALIINSGTPPQITTTTLSLGTIGQTYTFPFAATGGAGGYQWSIIGSSPDPGLQMSSSGVLQGTSTVPNDCPTGPGIWIGNAPPFGTFSSAYFQVQVTDSAGQSTNKQFCLPSYYPTSVVNNFMPASITVNGQSQTITVNGLNFRSGAYLTGNGTGLFPVTFVNNSVLTFPLTPGTSAAYSLPGGGGIGEGTYPFWLVQPYSYISNQNETVTIYDPVPAISGVQAVLNNSTQPCTSNLNCQLIVNGSGFVFSTQYQVGQNNLGSCVAQKPSTPIPWNTVTTCAFSLPSAGTYTLTVTNSNQPGGGTVSATAQFTLTQ